MSSSPLIHELEAILAELCLNAVKLNLLSDTAQVVDILNQIGKENQYRIMTVPQEIPDLYTYDTYYELDDEGSVAFHPLPPSLINIFKSVLQTSLARELLCEIRIQSILIVLTIGNHLKKNGHATI